MKKENLITFKSKEKIEEILNNLLNRILIFYTITSYIAIAAVFSRFLFTSSTKTTFLYTPLIIILSITTIYRNKLSYNNKLNIFLFLLVIPCIISYYSLGLSGAGRLFTIISISFAALFGSALLSNSILIFNIIIITIFMFLHCNNTISIPISLNEYNKLYPSWITSILILTMFIGIVIAAMRGLFNKLKQLAEESLNQAYKIRELNNNLEQKIEQRTLELKQSNKEKDRIMGVVAHDINNKIAGVISTLDILEKKYAKISDEEKLDYIKNAFDYSVFSAEIVKDLQDYSHQQVIENFSMETSDLYAFIQSSIECSIPKAELKKIKIKTEFTNQSISCSINKAKMSRVIDNLLSNAIKFTPASGEITIHIDADDKHAQISVTDTGIGIPVALQENIFEPFTPSSRPGTENEKSTGLGLSISKQIVEMHSGNIWFDSTENKGTTVYIQLPIV